jgi:acyl-[acyl-carrier-protein]-phospholipid O-acyltransferase/long-chain-fatty-acid--[acyl-carrier-protein] ligase
MPDPGKGEAIVLLTTSPDLERALLSATARSLGLSELAVARVLIRVAEIPLLGTGKTDYVRLKSIAEEGAGQPPRAAEALS